jgi:hypothetical protein
LDKLYPLFLQPYPIPDFMKNPLRSLLNLCAFCLLLVALYLNFVDLNKSESAAPIQQWVEQGGSATVAKASHTTNLKH